MSDYDDEFWGQGGSYTVGKDGKRVRVEETLDHADGNRPREAEEPAAPPAQSSILNPTQEV